jgi:hypothetical protein
MLINKSQIAVEVEGAEGTAETLVAADYVLAGNIKFDPVIETVMRECKAADLSPFAHVVGGKTAKLSFDVYLYGTAAAGSTLDYADALKACGLAEALAPGTSATYTPTSASVPSATIGWYMDGKAYKMWGARGNVSLILEKGQPGILRFEFTGCNWSETDTALLAGVTVPSVIPPAFLAATLTIDSYAALVSRVEINLNNEVVLRPDANSASGYKSAVITGRAPTLTFDPENVLASAEEFIGHWASGTQMAFSAVVGSATGGNKFTVTAPKVQYREIAMADTGGISRFEITGHLARNAGNDELSIAAT